MRVPLREPDGSYRLLDPIVIQVIAVPTFTHILLPSFFRLVDRKFRETQGCAYQATVIKSTI
jgi:hypothetical protein